MEPTLTTDRLAGLRLAVGTFTILPVRPPASLTLPVARRAMLGAPLVGLGLGLVAALVLEGARFATQHSPGGTLLAAVLTIATLAVLTRGLHLDGLADTADGLGSARPSADALAIMKRSDIGPFGVITLVLVLLLQVVALDTAVGHGAGGLSVVVSVVVGRLAASWGCARGVPAARPDGLGAAVAGSVGIPALLLLSLGVLAGSVGLSLLDDDHGVAMTLRTFGALFVGLAAAGLLLWRCVRRFGGVTGDVLGALVEVATTAALVCFAIG